jgi:fido (protein-threonine AMPylation protein)
VGDETGRVGFPDRDPVRTYSPEEQRALTSNLVAIARAIHAGDTRSWPLTVALLCEFHRALFAGVREHAGRIRTKGRGTPVLFFGPNRSAQREDVESLLAAAFATARESVASLQENGDDPEFDRAAIRVAAWVHAEIIRIHPFEDGNGRSSRLVMSHVLVLLGLRPIPLEAAKQEYRAVLNSYFSGQSDILPLVDLLLRLYASDT